MNSTITEPPTKRKVEIGWDYSAATLDEVRVIYVKVGVCIKEKDRVN